MQAPPTLPHLPQQPPGPTWVHFATSVGTQATAGPFLTQALAQQWAQDTLGDSYHGNWALGPAQPCPSGYILAYFEQWGSEEALLGIAQAFKALCTAEGMGYAGRAYSALADLADYVSTIEP